jgi:Fur family ferric uptake transcriptional regulator/Fur family peroxide stress response transcriptional regulator
MTTPDTHFIIDKLRATGIKPSAQRIEIMRYIMGHKTHPTVDEIFQSLMADNPTLSRTTVYNTVWLLAKSGAINTINIDRANARFDYWESPHAHFRCKKCGKILDLPFDYSTVERPAGLKIDNIDLFFEGECPDCLRLDEH